MANQDCETKLENGQMWGQTERSPFFFTLGTNVGTDGTFPVLFYPWGREPENDPAATRLLENVKKSGRAAYELP